MAAEAVSPLLLAALSMSDVKADKVLDAASDGLKFAEALSVSALARRKVCGQHLTV